jgi:hypothetical protein
MVTQTLYFFITSLIIASLARSHVVRPFDADLTRDKRDVSRMLRLVKDAQVPHALPALTTVSSTTPGIDPEFFRTLQSEWIQRFDWNERQEYINRFESFIQSISSGLSQFLVLIISKWRLKT